MRLIGLLMACALLLSGCVPELRERIHCETSSDCFLGEFCNADGRCVPGERDAGAEGDAAQPESEPPVLFSVRVAFKLLSAGKGVPLDIGFCSDPEAERTEASQLVQSCPGSVHLRLVNGGGEGQLNMTCRHPGPGGAGGESVAVSAGDSLDTLFEARQVQQEGQTHQVDVIISQGGEEVARCDDMPVMLPSQLDQIGIWNLEASEAAAAGEVSIQVNQLIYTLGQKEFDLKAGEGDWSGLYSVSDPSPFISGESGLRLDFNNLDALYILFERAQINQQISPSDSPN